ncbi:AMP-binding protein, partial [Chryseobacterium potabilaquae]|uniref:AMP-binding protein n=1 Tax=Chryseobacterium potabilaquae TaxID=2675057 RepID=UPI001389A583
MFPLSQSQLGLYSEYIQYPDLTQYNFPYYFKFSNKINVQKLILAIENVLKKYPIFYTKIIEKDGELFQYSDDNLHIDIPHIVIKNEELGNIENLLQQFVRPFDLQKDALVRFLIIETNETIYFAHDIHHLIIDGTTIDILYRHIELAYNNVDLPVEICSLYEYAEQEPNLFETPQYNISKEYYQKLFKEVKMTKMPGKLNDNPGTLKQTSVYVSKNIIKEACNKYEIKPSWLFMAAFEIVLSRFNREEAIAYSTVLNGRNDKSLHNSLGMFAKTSPVFAKINNATKVIDYIRAHKETLNSIRTHEIFPFTHFCNQLNIVPKISFGFQGSLMKDNINFLGEDVVRVHIMERKSPQKPTIVIYDNGIEYDIRLQYAEGQYSNSMMQQFVNAMGICVIQMITFPEKILKDLSIVSEPEYQELLSLGKGEELTYDRSETFIDLFKKQVLLYPTKTAVVDQWGKISYSKLDQMSDKLSSILIENGIEVDQFVSLMLPRCKEFLISILAVFKAGGAYVPLDSDYPTDRLQYMLNDSQSKVLITTRSLFTEKQKNGNFAVENIIFVDEIDLTQYADPINRSKADNLAYMIYTSGSTGKPKGVMIEHKSLRSFVEWRASCLEVNSDDCCLQQLSFSFDASLEDLIVPLSVGAEIHILSSSLRQDMEGMYQYFKLHKITRTSLSTQLGMEMLNQYDLPLRYLMMGGEKLKTTKPSSAKIINGYGPTEFTVCSSFHILDPKREYQNIPIGRPVPNSISVIVDAHGNLIPKGMVG